MPSVPLATTSLLWKYLCHQSLTACLPFTTRYRASKATAFINELLTSVQRFLVLIVTGLCLPAMGQFALEFTSFYNKVYNQKQNQRFVNSEAVCFESSSSSSVLSQVRIKNWLSAASTSPIMILGMS